MCSGKSKRKRKRRPSSSADVNLSAKQWRGPAKQISEKAIRNDIFGHWPEYSEKRVVQISKMQRQP